MSSAPQGVVGLAPGAEVQPIGPTAAALKHNDWLQALQGAGPGMMLDVSCDPVAATSRGYLQLSWYLHEAGRVVQDEG